MCAPEMGKPVPNESHERVPRGNKRALRKKGGKTKSTHSKHAAAAVPYEAFCPCIAPSRMPNRVLLAFVYCVPCHMHIAVCMESSLLLWPCH